MMHNERCYNEEKFTFLRKERNMYKRMLRNCSGLCKYIDWLYFALAVSAISISKIVF